jgi:hypothetical protein
MLETVGIRVLTRNFRDFHSLLLFSHIKFVPLLDVHQSQTASAKILMYLESSWLHLIISKLLLNCLLW